MCYNSEVEYLKGEDLESPLWRANQKMELEMVG